MTTKLASTSLPWKSSFALPAAATAGTLVRSPVSVLMGRSLIAPSTDRSRCTLLSARVAVLESLSRVAASGRDSEDFSEEDEQPEMSTNAAKSAVRIGQRD